VRGSQIVVMLLWGSDRRSGINLYCGTIRDGRLEEVGTVFFDSGHPTCRAVYLRTNVWDYEQIPSKFSKWNEYFACVVEAA